MLRVRHLFNLFLIVLAAEFSLASLAGAEEAVSFKKNETSLYRDLFDQNLYYEGTNYLRLERLYRRLFGKKAHALNINVFDEVPDGIFFTNRQARKKMSNDELEKGYVQTEGPDLSGNLTILHSEFEGLQPSFLVKDTRGDEYLIKFDSVDNFELSTSTEVIANRFYYAFGYNVPQETVVYFEPSKLVIGADAKVRDDSGFTKKLTPELLEQYLLFLSQDGEGHFRAIARKILPGEEKGGFSLYNRRKNDTEDPVNHRDRREIRGLRVFSSWLNNTDVRESATLDMFQTGDGHSALRHYLVDFGSALGAADKGAKHPMAGHEYIVDYGDTLKAFVALGFWEKPWQKRWREVGEQVPGSPAVGYLDNRYFNPGNYKTDLPYYAFKDVTRADGFWAAKIIMSFSEEDIRSMVKAGRLKESKDAENVAGILIERQKLIGRYWFDQVSSLDEVDLSGKELTFKDLAVEYGFHSAQETTYLVDVIAKDGKRGKKITSFESQKPSLNIDPNWLSQNKGVDLLIRTRRGSAKPNSYVLVELNAQGVQGVSHED